MTYTKKNKAFRKSYIKNRLQDEKLNWKNVNAVSAYFLTDKK